MQLRAHAQAAARRSGGRRARPGQARRATDARRACVLAGLLALIGADGRARCWCKAWPSFSHNGLSWFGPGGDVDTQLRAMREDTPLPGHSIYYFRAWPLIWGTMLTTVLAVLIALVDLDAGRDLPDRVRAGAGAPHARTRDRLLAGVPSVIYGLIGILAIAPWINEHLISKRPQAVGRSTSCSSTATNLATADLILTVMILPIMVAISANALAVGAARPGARARPRWASTAGGRSGGSRCAPPGRRSRRRTVLATARALGEAVMLAMVSGGRPFAANPLDGITFLFEPVRPLAATIIQESEGLTHRAAGAHDLCDRGRAAGVGGAAVAGRLGRQAAASRALRDRRGPDGEPPSCAGSRLRPPTGRRAARRSCVRPREGIAPGRCVDRICLLAVLGQRHRAVLDRGGDRAVHARQGHRLSAPRRMLLQLAQRRRCMQNTERRLPRPDRGHAASSPRSASCIAAPVGVGIAAWLSEYARPAWLARAVESAIEMIAGVPSVVLALFGLLVFSQSFLGFLSPARRQRSGDGRVVPRSAGIVMALLALPLIVAATREALAQLPDRTREASYALGKTRATTIRHVLLPSIRPSDRERGRARAWAGSSATPRSSRSCWARAPTTEAVGRPADPLNAAGHRLDADQLRLLQLPCRRGQLARKGLRGGVRAAVDRARAERDRDAISSGRRWEHGHWAGAAGQSTRCGEHARTRTRNDRTAHVRARHTRARDPCRAQHDPIRRRQWTR